MPIRSTARFDPAMATMNPMKMTRYTALAAVLLLSPLCASAGAWEFAFYGGSSWHHDADVELTTPTASLEFEDVAWRSDSFQSPPHWGVRVSRWFGAENRFAVALDFVHAKVIAEGDEQVAVSGTRNGVAVNTTERVDATFSRYEYTDGLNLGTLNLLYRVPGFSTRVTPYVGLGIGAAVPHVEVTAPGVRAYEYQTAGVTGHGLIGLSGLVTEHIGAFVEYKAGYTDIEADLPGGSVSHDLFSHHINFGLLVRF
jgi:lipid A oxidase